jgi:hypothetical protein
MTDVQFPAVRLIVVPWLIPRWARAQVWGRTILIRRGVSLTEELLAHELAHVRQWQKLGRRGFLWLYACHLIRSGYCNHPLELEARAAEHSEFYLDWARHLLQLRKS